MRLYKVTLNWYGEIHLFFTHANSESRARRNVYGQFGAKMGRTYSAVKRYFIDHPLGVKIGEVIPDGQ